VHPSDPAVALLALDARVVVRQGKGTRAVPLAEFYVLPEDDSLRETVLGPDELVVGVEIPAPSSDARSSYTKFKFRESWDFAVVSVALAVEAPGGAVRRGRVALGGVAPVPWLDADASAALAGIGRDEGGRAAFANALLANAEPMEENGFKVPLARNLAKRAVRELLERAQP
jgi:xanthine dehydrogenase YagS FAD-binding subunit